MPLNILSKVISSVYLTFIPFLLISEGVWKTKPRGMFNSNFELKIQKHDSHFAFL